MNYRQFGTQRSELTVYFRNLVIDLDLIAGELFTVNTLKQSNGFGVPPVLILDTRFTLGVKPCGVGKVFGHRQCFILCLLPLLFAVKYDTGFREPLYLCIDASFFRVKLILVVDIVLFNEAMSLDVALQPLYFRVIDPIIGPLALTDKAENIHPVREYAVIT